MNIPRIARTLAFVLVFVVAVAGAWAAGEAEGEAAAVDKPMVTDPTTGKMLTAPEYGGTLTYPYKLVAANTDPDLRGHYAGWLISAVNEKLALGDWAAPRDQMSLTGWYVPTSGFVGGLAESWEQPDDLTTVLNIRQGVHWHDKEPVNGRELTADDVVYTFRRRAGLTDFVPERTYEMIGLPWESIEATDRYTVVLKLSEPRLGSLRVYLAEVIQWILPPEVIEQNGDYSDWRNVVGTGPYMLTDYVEGTSITRTRNPNYWGHDEKYPDNQLPYADELRGLFMEEEATRIAAMRTGQVDIIHTSGGATEIKTAEQVEALLRTNPDIQVGPYFIRALQVFGVNQRRAPFDDIRVRQALQMSIDREAINESYYGGYALWKPQGHFGNAVAGYHVPFDEWPEEVKATYRYNPEEAKRLLDEAGHPPNAEGVRLRVAYDHRDVIDLGFAEIAAGYWKEIGVELEINIMDTTTWVSRRKDKSYEMTTGDSGWDLAPVQLMGFYRGIAEGDQELRQEVEYLGGLGDETMTRLYDEFNSATSEDERIRIAREFDAHYIRHHFQIYGVKAPGFSVAQPWLKGWNGETFLQDMDNHLTLVRLWLDLDLKAEMGY